MRAVEITELGGPRVMRVVDRPAPEPAADQVVVEVAAAGVNFRDTYERDGTYPAQLPLRMGAEGAGTVTAVGAGVQDIAVGDRVAWAGAPGSYAEQVAVTAGAAVPVPDGVSDESAAAVMLQGMTAHYLATSTFPVSAGDVALVHAGAGGVGLLLTQLIRLRGGIVVSTVSTEEKEALSRGAGARDVIRYDRPDVDIAAEVRRLTGGVGVAVVYDGVGKSTFDASLRSLRPRGMMVLYGGASGQVPPFDPQELNRLGSLFLTRPTLVHYIAGRAELTARTEEIFGWIAAGALDVRVGGRYPLADAPRAHQDLQSRRTTGKLLLLPR